VTGVTGVTGMRPSARSWTGGARRLAPVLALTAALAAALGVAPAARAGATAAATPAAAPAAEATGEARARAEALFGRYIDLEHAFDPALLDLYSDTARIEHRIVVPGQRPVVRNWSGAQYKELLRRALQKAKQTKEDLNYYSAISYQREGSRVRIKAMRYAQMQKAVSPVQLLVGPDGGGTWRIFEERSESRPLAAPAPVKPPATAPAPAKPPATGPAKPPATGPGKPPATGPGKPPATKPPA
jgi:hypothetical protein